METVTENIQTTKPKWLKVKLPIGQKYTELRGLVDKYSLNTICTSGKFALIWENAGVKEQRLL